MGAGRLSAAMAARPDDETDPYLRMAAYCVEGIADSPAELERVARVKLLLVARGIAADDRLAADWLAPALCTNAEEQKRFHRRFDDFLARGAPAAGDETGGAGGEAGAEAAPEGRRRIGGHALKQSYALAAVPVAIVAWILWGKLRGGGPEAVSNLIVDSTIILPTPGGPSPELVWGANWGAIMILAMLALLGAAAFMLTRAHRARLVRDFAPAPRAAGATVRARELPKLFAGARLSRSLGILRRHKEAPSRKIEIRRSIRATIRAGGRAVVRFGSRPATPEYLLMADHRSPRDHLPVVADALQYQFAQERIVAGRFDYFGKPDRLRPVPAGPARGMPMADITALNSGARVIALAEARECAEAQGGNDDNAWMHMFRELDQPTLLDPRRPGCWDALERQIEDAGVLVVPATPQGLEGYAERLSARGMKWPARWHAPNRQEEDAVGRLLADRRQLLNDEPPSKLRLDEILLDLERSLGADSLLLLRAAALHPVLDPGLTLHLAANLTGADGAPLLNEANFLAVARLPWMRAGHMPGWLREPLVRRLDAAAIERAVTLIQSYLVPNLLPDGTSEVDPGGGTDKNERLKLLAWIGENPESELYDPLLFDALTGAPPHRLGVPRDPNRPGRPLNVWRGQDIVFAALLLAALGTVAWVNPPLQRVPPAAAEPRDLTAEENQAQDNAGDAATNTIYGDGNPATNAAGAADGAGDTGANSAATNATGTTGEGDKGDDTAGESNTIAPVAPIAGPFVVYFDWQKDEITPYAAAILDNAAAGYAAMAEGGRQVTVTIAGYSDREMSEDESLAISRRRADSVVAYLTGRGIPRSVVTVLAHGETRPLVDTADGVREPQNRRVEISFAYVRPPQQPPREQQQLRRQRTPRLAPRTGN
jgi:outer membrane protein OmpA-like peptidoglycan-associated protein